MYNIMINEHQNLWFINRPFSALQSQSMLPLAKTYKTPSEWWNRMRWTLFNWFLNILNIFTVRHPNCKARPNLSSILPSIYLHAPRRNYEILQGCRYSSQVCRTTILFEIHFIKTSKRSYCSPEKLCVDRIIGRDGLDYCSWMLPCLMSDTVRMSKTASVLRQSASQVPRLRSSHPPSI